jgi:hypothetical protein
MLTRGHAVFLRRDNARVAVALRLEFSRQDHTIGRSFEEAHELLAKRCVRHINDGRKTGTIPPGPPAEPSLSPSSEHLRGL